MFWAKLPWRPVPYAVGIAFVLHACGSNDVDPRAPNKSSALATTLSARGLACEGQDVVWVRGAASVRGAITGGARALVRATPSRSADREPRDLFVVDARLSPEGVLLEVGDAWNVTRTTGAEESVPILNGSIAAYSTNVDGTFTGLHTLDLAGQSPALYTDFTRVQRWQTALTNLQQTGQTSGVLHEAYSLAPPANEVTVAWSGANMLALADGRRVVIDPRAGAPIEGASWVRAAPEVKARPGNVTTWAVDRVRAMPWFGDEKMQLLKAVAFTGLDWFTRARTRIVGDSSATDVADDLGGVNSGQREAVALTDPELGWPPAPMKPAIAPPLPGEGAWIMLDRDPFIRQTPGVPGAFVTSFVRTDKERLATRVYVTMWDPRQIALHMEAGTIEPVSATGAAGPGVIPRTPEILKRVVGGFNGGFQATHGEYGMQANGIMYLPPKQYGATVVELKDGTTGFGAWPSSTEVPDEVLSYRQNLTALVQNDKFNPWGRTWWGGVPPGWQDTIHTTRSGICLTKENFVAYFWGDDISAEVLARGMLLARCAFGIHLDMNPGLAGFEFYNVQEAATWKPLGRPLQSTWEYEAKFKDMPGLQVRARRMVKGMGHINFPQYIHRDGRDFFYLTARPMLPGEEIGKSGENGGNPARDPGEGSWRVKGLPQHGFPYALATTWVHLDPKRPEVKARVVRIDPRTVRPAPSPVDALTPAADEPPTVVAFAGSGGSAGSAGSVTDTNAGAGELVAWLGRGGFFIAKTPPSEGALAIASGLAPSALKAGGARVVAGVEDEDGMLVWIELADGVKPDAQALLAMDALAAKLGCGARVAITGDARVLLGGNLDAAGESLPNTAPPPGGPPRATARLVRAEAPSARPYFTSTPIVPIQVWQPLQMQRVRYFNKPAKPDAGAPPGK
jgi:hypothetical protein